MKLEEYINDIQPLDEAAMQAARARQDTLTKPRGSLGKLEELSIKLAGMKADPFPSVERKAVIVMAADHGVTAEGVSAYPSEVTAQMVLNFLRGGAAINVLAQQAGARVAVVDIGVATDFEPLPGLLRRKVRCGTRNLAQGAAMTRAEAEQAIQVGIDVLNEEAGNGLDIVATGDMGIGNTTSSSAIAAAILGLCCTKWAGWRSPGWPAS
jgi:nicotinate-nucleotide--dimethylbenzimidazole phosphoribosyltransferase